MKTMTFNGRTMREAIALAKARFGADVDILDSGAVGDEVQVTVVVPESRAAGRRRRGIEQVASGIKARAAASGIAPVADEAHADRDVKSAQPAADDAKAVAEDKPESSRKAAAVAGADKASDTALESAASASVEAPADAQASAASAESEPAESAKGRAKAKTTRTRKSRAKKDADVEKIADAERTADAGKAADAGNTSVAASTNAQARMGAATSAASAASTEAQRAPSAAASVLASSSETGMVNASAAGSVSGLANTAGAVEGRPVSTLDFELQRRQKQQEKAAQSLVMPTSAPAAQPGVAGQLSGFASLLQAQQQASQAQQTPVPAGAAPDSAGLAGNGMPSAHAGFLQAASGPAAAAQSAYQASLASGAETLAGAVNGAGVANGAGVVNGAGVATVSGTAQGAAAAVSAAQHTAAALEHAARAPRSRLWAMVDSARRMFRKPSVWASASEQDTGADETSARFGEQSAMSLSSTLTQPEASAEWPSLRMPGQGLEALAASVQSAPAGADQPVGLGWFDAMRRRPGQLRLLRNLMGCQFSPALARTLVELLPVDYSDVQADEWLRQTLMRALAGVNTAAGMVTGSEQSIFEKGGVFALIGPTGVGKTTSIAKIAAHHVLRHGPRQLALITADVYRIGAQEQLRAFGKMLGVPVHVAQDRDILEQLLKEHEDRSLVLIDTAGISQRDERVEQLTRALELSQVRRVLVMNAAAQAGTLEEVLDAFGARDAAGVLLSKVDEAVGLGGCLDALVRHRLPLLGYTDGQRVPEDYHPVDFVRLIDQALDLKVASRMRSMLTDTELRNLFEESHV